MTTKLPDKSRNAPAFRYRARLTSSGCLAAWRRESFGTGIAVSRNYSPAMPGAPQRCGAYAPGPDDRDRRDGREHWPFLFVEPIE